MCWILIPQLPGRWPPFSSTQRCPRSSTGRWALQLLRQAPHQVRERIGTVAALAVLRDLDRYPDAELVWVQDEPENQGAWPFIALEVVTHLKGRTIRRISRDAAASTATGSPKVHAREQAAILEEALAV